MDNVHIPREWLTFDRAQVNAFCRNTDRFVLSGGWIAQCEFGSGANPENGYAVFRAWNGD